MVVVSLDAVVADIAMNGAEGPIYAALNAVLLIVDESGRRHEIFVLL
jgi:hypothetical protein